MRQFEIHYSEFNSFEDLSSPFITHVFVEAASEEDAINTLPGDVWFIINDITPPDYVEQLQLVWNR